MRFGEDLVMRWFLARTCSSGPAGGPCADCTEVIYDTMSEAAHLRAARHGFRGCPECRADWARVLPCRLQGEASC
jgi:hypothetical protein